MFLASAMDKNNKQRAIQNGLTLDCHNYLANLHHNSSPCQEQGNKRNDARGSNGLRRERITVFNDTPPYISEYSVYRGQNSMTGTPITEQPYTQKSLSLEGQSFPASTDPINEEDPVTADVIRSHFCYYIICCGLWCD